MFSRRQFLKTLPAASLGIGAIPAREVRQSMTISGSVRAHIIVSAHPGEQPAERYRRSWIGQPFEGMGEWYVDSREQQKLPPRLATLPGTLSLARTTVGAAAERRQYLIGAFRQEHIAIVVRILGNNGETMIEIGDHIAAQPIPGPFETAWSSVLLQAFIPKSADLGKTVEFDDRFWP